MRALPACRLGFACQKPSGRLPANCLTSAALYLLPYGLNVTRRSLRRPTRQQIRGVCAAMNCRPGEHTKNNHHHQSAENTGTGEHRKKYHRSQPVAHQTQLTGHSQRQKTGSFRLLPCRGSLSSLFPKQLPRMCGHIHPKCRKKFRFQCP